jgi:hypothetical protein
MTVRRQSVTPWYSGIRHRARLPMAGSFRPDRRFGTDGSRGVPRDPDPERRQKSRGGFIELRARVVLLARLLRLDRALLISVSLAVAAVVRHRVHKVDGRGRRARSSGPPPGRGGDIAETDRSLAIGLCPVGDRGRGPCGSHGRPPPPPSLFPGPSSGSARSGPPRIHTVLPTRTRRPGPGACPITTPQPAGNGRGPCSTASTPASNARS